MAKNENLYEKGCSHVPVMKLTGIPTISTRKTPINEYHINATEYNHSSTQLSLKKCILDLESDVYVDFM